MLRSGLCSLGSLVVALVALALSSACAGPRGPSPVWGGANSDPALINVLPASFAEHSRLPRAVELECDVQHRMPEWIARFSSAPIVLALDRGQAPRVLELTIRSGVADSGGMWSGPKQLDVHGDLFEGENLLASFDVRRTTLTGGWAASGSTCEVLDYISESIAKDIGPWLSHPIHGARLGELRP